MSPITQQPFTSLMNSTKRPEDHENPCGAGRHTHQSCHYTRLRRIILPTLFVLLVAAALLFLEFGDFESGVVGTSSGLLRRATGTDNNGNNSSFVKNKLYLIIVIVGLFLVLIAAIALSAWCCRGAFQNPLCCPCYLCACCGGLACLECISCGLCAEGFEDLNV